MRRPQVTGVVILASMLLLSACGADPVPSTSLEPLPSQPAEPMTYEEWQEAQESSGLTCVREDHTNPDVPPGYSLVCEATDGTADLRVMTQYAPEGAFRGVHATLLASQAEGDVSASAQRGAIRIVTSFRYAGANPNRAGEALADDLSNNECRGQNCIHEIGTGTFYFQTGDRGAFGVSLEPDSDQ